MLKEREIALEWVARVLEEPARTEQKADGTIHYLKSVTERDGRVLRVVTRPGKSPIVITMFLDRRERGE